MKILEKMEYLGKEFNLTYRDCDDFSKLDYTKCKQCYGVCFYNGKLLIGFGGRKQGWGLVGGTVEKDEPLEKTLARELQEETNTEVIKYWPIGYQVTEGETNLQLRYACLVKPYGPFVSDPDGGITAIKFIDPKDYKQYFNWGKIGDRLISRAQEIIKSKEQ